MDALADGGIPGGGLLADADTTLGGGLALLLDELAHGLLVTTIHGRLLHANQAARHELERRRVLGTRHSLVHACTPEGGKRLHEALAKVGKGRRSLFELTAPEGPAFPAMTGTPRR